MEEICRDLPLQENQICSSHTEMSVSHSKQPVTNFGAATDFIAEPDRINESANER